MTEVSISVLFTTTEEESELIRKFLERRIFKSIEELYDGIYHTSPQINITQRKLI